MADKKMVEQITSMEEDFAQWYTDVVLKAELIGYTSVKGCMAIKPAGYAIWELIQKQLDERFKAAGVQNVYMPMFIPESLLEKEKDHVEGFAPEVAWVTYGGLQKLQERLCVRPTSETLFCDFYKNDIQSYRDLPKVYNQWCNVVRWEKETRPFLRSREFLWQEGHTAHATAEEAEERTIQMLNVYADFCEEVLAIPVVKGRKTDKEKFAGAEATYTIESLMHDGKALIVYFRQITVRMNISGVEIAEQCLRSWTYTHTLLKRLQSSVCYPCYFRCKTFYMIFFFLKQTFRDQHRHVYILYAGLFESAIQLMLDILPDCIACWFDRHTSFYAGIIDQLCFFYHIGIPLCKIFIHRCDCFN